MSSARLSSMPVGACPDTGLTDPAVTGSMLDSVVHRTAIQTAPEGYEHARRAFIQGSWMEAVRAAAKVLEIDPMHAAGFELLVTARRNLEMAGAPAGELRFLSVLMCDLVGSSRLTRVL